MKHLPFTKLAAMTQAQLTAELEKVGAELLKMRMHLQADSEADNSKIGKLSQYRAQICTARRQQELAAPFSTIA